jgi:NAD-dependent SIR2 family protein deacetylase
VFVAVGTSLQVQPAASLAGLAAEHGARLVIVNAEPTPYDHLAAELIREPIGTSLPALLASFEESREFEDAEDAEEIKDVGDVGEMKDVKDAD